MPADGEGLVAALAGFGGPAGGAVALRCARQCADAGVFAGEQRWGPGDLDGVMPGAIDLVGSEHPDAPTAGVVTGSGAVPG